MIIKESDIANLGSPGFLLIAIIEANAILVISLHHISNILLVLH